MVTQTSQFTEVPDKKAHTHKLFPSISFRVDNVAYVHTSIVGDVWEY